MMLDVLLRRVGAGDGDGEVARQRGSARSSAPSPSGRPAGRRPGGGGRSGASGGQARGDAAPRQAASIGRRPAIAARVAAGHPHAVLQHADRLRRCTGPSSGGDDASPDAPCAPAPAAASAPGPAPGSGPRRRHAGSWRPGPAGCWSSAAPPAPAAGRARRSAMAISTCRLTCTWLSAPGVPKTPQSVPSLNTIGAFIVWRTRMPGRSRFGWPSCQMPIGHAVVQQHAGIARRHAAAEGGVDATGWRRPHCPPHRPRRNRWCRSPAPAAAAGRRRGAGRSARPVPRRSPPTAAARAGCRGRADRCPSVRGRGRRASSPPPAGGSAPGCPGQRRKVEAVEDAQHLQEGEAGGIRRGLAHLEAADRARRWAPGARRCRRRGRRPRPRRRPRRCPAASRAASLPR